MKHCIRTRFRKPLGMMVVKGGERLILSSTEQGTYDGGLPSFNLIVLYLTQIYQFLQSKNRPQGLNYYIQELQVLCC